MVQQQRQRPPAGGSVAVTQPVCLTAAAQTGSSTPALSDLQMPAGVAHLSRASTGFPAATCVQEQP